MIITWIRRLYYLYCVSLPGLGLSAVFILDIPAFKELRSPLWLVGGFLAIIPLACYLSFTTEVVPFPKHLPSALFTVFFIPVELVVSTILDSVSIWNVFVIQTTTELLGVMGLIVVLVMMKQTSSQRNWFNATILGVGALCAGVVSYLVFLPALPIGLISYLGSAAAVVAIAIRYYGYLKSGVRNTTHFSANFIIIGLLLTVSLPVLTWLLRLSFDLL